MTIANSQDANQQEEEKLEDILKSIRNMIDGHNPSETKATENKKLDGNKDNNSKLTNSSLQEADDDSVLELTSELTNEYSGLLSSEAVKKSSEIMNNFSQQINEVTPAKTVDKFDLMITELVKPLLKDWLDSNLPALLEKIIAEELKKIMPKR